MTTSRRSATKESSPPASETTPGRETARTRRVPRSARIQTAGQTTSTTQFAELGPGVDDGDLGGGASGLSPRDSDVSDTEPDDQPRSGSGPPTPGPAESSSERRSPGGDDSDPFAELSEGTGETDAALEDAFERMDVGGATDEDVWESLDEDLASGPDGPTVEPGAEELSERSEPTAAPGPDGAAEHVVDKRSYCQQCPHFSAPPDVACGHEGTTIAEVIGFDEFRVRNCPMVSDDDPTFTDRR